MMFPYQQALITGATSGIGLGYCHLLADHSVNLIIVSRNVVSLDALAQELKQKYAIKVTVIAADLSEEDAADNIFKVVNEQGLKIDLLINNAGRADFGAFDKTPWIQHRALINLMLTSLTKLSYLFLPQLLACEKGALINVSSIAGLIGLSPKGRTHRVLYRPIKSFVVAFSEQLMKTYKDKGLVVQALCPGLTYSQFHQRSGDTKLFDAVPKWMWTSADYVVKKSISSLVGSHRLCVIPGWHNRLAVLMGCIMDLFKR